MKCRSGRDVNILDGEIRLCHQQKAQLRYANNVLRIAFHLCGLIATHNARRRKEQTEHISRVQIPGHLFSSITNLTEYPVRTALRTTRSDEVVDGQVR